MAYSFAFFTLFHLSLTFFEQSFPLIFVRDLSHLVVWTQLRYDLAYFDLDNVQIFNLQTNTVYKLLKKSVEI